MKSYECTLTALPAADSFRAILQFANPSGLAIIQTVVLHVHEKLHSLVGYLDLARGASSLVLVVRIRTVPSLEERFIPTHQAQHIQYYASRRTRNGREDVREGHGDASTVVSEYVKRGLPEPHPVCGVRGSAETHSMAGWRPGTYIQIHPVRRRASRGLDVGSVSGSITASGRCVRTAELHDRIVDD